jgi:predicted transcriptional regulator
MTRRPSSGFEHWAREQMRDPQFRAALQRLELAYQVARLRMLRGWTQQELARRAGTRRSAIARLESGKREPSLSFLRRVARTPGADDDCMAGMVHAVNEAIIECA